MKQNLLFKQLLVIILALVGSMSVWGADCTTIHTRTFLSSDWQVSSTNYTTAWSDLNCSFLGAANNNKAYDYVRLAVKGGSNTSSTKTATCYIMYDYAISNKVSKVIINHAGTTDAIGTNLSINYVALSVYNGSTKVDSIVINSSSLSFEKNVSGTIEFAPTSGTSWDSGYKYRFYANIYCKGTSNRGINISSIQFDNCESGSTKTSISPTLSYESTTLTVGGGNSSAPTVSGNTGSGTCTYSLENVSPAGCATIEPSTGVITPVSEGTATAKVTIAETSEYNAGTATCAITINVAPAVHRTVTWYVNSEVYSAGGTTDVEDGSKVTTLPTEPSVPDGCSGKVFVGWTTAKIETAQPGAPSVLFKDAASAPTVSGGDANYYAVFADEN